MKSKLKILFGLFVLLIITLPTFAQVLDLEKTYAITGKSKRGALANVEYNASTGYKLTYVTKSNDKLAKFQIYTFDKDFNFLKLEEDELEFEKAKTKYSWFKFRGEEYSVEGVFVEPNLVGTLVLKRKKITYKYDWFLLGYYKDVEILEKVKPKTDDGRVFFYYSHAEDDVTGDVYILCGSKDKMAKGADPYRHTKELFMLKFNKDLDLVKETPLKKFDYPQGLLFSRFITKNNPDDPENPGVGGMVFVFAPTGGPGMGKVADPDNTNYTFVRLDDKLNIKAQVPFKSFSSYWKVDEMIHETNSDAIFLFGPSAAGKDNYYNMLLSTTKYKAVQLMKVNSGGTVDYFTETNLEELEAKLTTPPSQKKSPAYKGKKFEIANYHVAPNGDFIVVGQNFEPSNAGIKYNDILAFHFDGIGKLKAQYSVDTKESNKFAKAAGTPQFFIDNDNTTIFWFLQEIKDLAAAKGKLLTYPRISKVDIGNGKLNDFAAFGADDKYYLDTKYPMLETEKGNMVVFFGSDRGGKTIWFCRVALK